MPHAAGALSARTRSYSFAADLTSMRLSESADGAHRSWVMLLPQGQYEHPKGTLDLTPAMLRQVKTNFDGGVRGVEIALDYDHRASEGDSRAFGWIEQVTLCEAGQSPDGKARQGELPAGLWGLIRWTRLGLADVRDEIYRYISAEFRPEWTNPVNGKTYKNVLIGAALTNRPFMNHMPAITLSQKEQGSTMAAAKKGTKKAPPVVEPEDDETEDLDDSMDDGDTEAYDEMDAEDAADGGDDEAEEEEQTQPAPRKKAGKKPAKGTAKMSEQMVEQGADVVALREQLEAQAVKLKEAEVKLAEASVKETLAAWETGTVKPSKALRDEYQAVMLSETVRGDSELAARITRLAEAAFKGAVDLSVRSGGTDMESRRDKKAGQGADGDDVVELANKYALSEHQKSIDTLSNSRSAEERKLAGEIIKRAARELNFQLVAR